MKPSKNKDCLSCRLFVTCKDKKKGYGYICDKYQPINLQTDSDKEYLIPPLNRIAPSDPEFSKENPEYQALELNLENVITELMSSSGKVPSDLKIDDRDLKEFPNFLEFTTSKEGLDIKPFSKQLALGLMCFAEYCPHCSHPSFNPSNLNKIPYRWHYEKLLEYVVPLKHGVCPKCKRNKANFFKRNKLNLYEELVVCLGQRSGKSFTTAMMCAYLLHRYLKLQRPLEVYGLARGSEVFGTFVGLTFQRAVNLLWMPFHSMIRTSPWFSGYHRLLEFYNEKYGEELFKLKDTYIRYGHRSITLNPSGPNKRTLRGELRFLYAIDELGWFDNSEDNEERERTSANETYTSLNNSMKDLRIAAKKVIVEEGYFNVPMACSFSISSPTNQHDKIMSLIKTYQGSSDVLTLHAPTWKFNPKYTKKDFSKDYRANPVVAERDFGANPPLNDSPFLNGVQQLISLFGPYKNQVEYTYTTKVSPSGQSMRAARIRRILKHGMIPRSILSLDAGFSNNSFALVVSHPKKYNNRYYPQVDVMIEVAPQFRENVLNYNKIQEEVIYPLIKAFNIGFVSADRWQSKTLLHNIENDFKIEAIEYSLTYDDFIDVKMCLQEDGSMTRFPALEMLPEKIDELEMVNYPHCFRYMPVSHFYYQCLTVTDKGNTVEKGLRLTDDIFRATCLGIAWLLDEDLLKKLMTSARSGSRGLIQGAGMTVSPDDIANINRLRTTQRQMFFKGSAIAKNNLSGKAIGAVGGKSKY